MRRVDETEGWKQKSTSLAGPNAGSRNQQVFHFIANGGEQFTVVWTASSCRRNLNWRCSQRDGQHGSMWSCRSFVLIERAFSSISLQVWLLRSDLEFGSLVFSLGNMAGVAVAARRWALAVLSSLKFSKFSVTSKSHQNIKYNKWRMHGTLNVSKQNNLLHNLDIHCEMNLLSLVSP